MLRYGVPDTVVTDMGSEFMASIFKESCELLQIKKLNSTAYHHETIGALENSHKNLGAYLRTQVNKFPNAWSSWVPYWCFAYNTTVHTETKYTPYELIFGKNARLPSNLTNRIDPLYNFDDFPLELKYRLQQARHDAKTNLEKCKLERKLRYDKSKKTVDYKIGDKIMLRNNLTHKLDPIYKGPYIIIEEKSPNVIIKIDNKIVEVHKNRIKLYHEH